MFCMLILITISLTFSITFVFSQRVFSDKIYNLKKREALYEKLDRIDRYVGDNFKGTIDEKVLLDSIAKGYVNGLGDEHSVYLTAAEYERVMAEAEGKIVSIGIRLMLNESGLPKIIEVYKNSPAEAVGLKIDDVIINIGTLKISAKNAPTIYLYLGGEAESSVKLKVSRGGEILEFEAVRKLIEIPTVSSKVIDNIGYISINSFSAPTPEQFDTALKGLRDKNVTGIIYDLRGNGGGTIDSVAKVLNLLLPNGPIVFAEYKNGEKVLLENAKGVKYNTPTIILINSKTASAAELFTQALKDYNLTLAIVGTTSYGKGTMQETYKLPDGSAVLLTTARFFPPKSDNFDKIGITPTNEVILTAEQEQNFYKLPLEKDPQFLKALELFAIKK